MQLDLITYQTYQTISVELTLTAMSFIQDVLCPILDSTWHLNRTKPTLCPSTSDSYYYQEKQAFTPYLQNSGTVECHLSSKVDVGRRLRQAYQAGDKESLQQIARELPKLKPDWNLPYITLSQQWLKKTRSLAWMMDTRMGGLQRIKRAESRGKLT